MPPPPPTPVLIKFLLRLAHTLSCPPLAPPDLKELETTAKPATISRALEMEKVQRSRYTRRLVTTIFSSP